MQKLRWGIPNVVQLNFSMCIQLCREYLHAMLELYENVMKSKFHQSEEDALL